jgi:hypothetical protein
LDGVGLGTAVGIGFVGAHGKKGQETEGSNASEVLAVPEAPTAPLGQVGIVADGKTAYVVDGLPASMGFEFNELFNFLFCHVSDYLR